MSRPTATNAIAAPLHARTWSVAPTYPARSLARMAASYSAIGRTTSLAGCIMPTCHELACHMAAPHPPHPPQVWEAERKHAQTLSQDIANKSNKSYLYSKAVRTYWPRLIATCLGWVVNDFAFYGGCKNPYMLERFCSPPPSCPRCAGALHADPSRHC